MTISPDPVNTWSQPAMFGPRAVAVSLLALIDPEDETVLFVCEAREAPGERLVALYSTSPVPMHEHLRKLSEAYKEFTAMLWDATGPF